MDIVRGWKQTATDYAETGRFSCYRDSSHPPRWSVSWDARFVAKIEGGLPAVRKFMKASWRLLEALQRHKYEKGLAAGVPCRHCKKKADGVEPFKHDYFTLKGKFFCSQACAVMDAELV